jgi:hypothetical protein
MFSYTPFHFMCSIMPWHLTHFFHWIMVSSSADSMHVSLQEYKLHDCGGFAVYTSVWVFSRDDHLSVKYMSMHIWDVWLLKFYAYNYTFFVSWLGGWLRWSICNLNEIFKILCLCTKMYKFMKKIWFLASKCYSFSCFGYSGRDYIFPLH